SDEKPVITSTGSGEYVLAQFADVGYLLLDANTGRRRAAWPSRTRDRFIQQSMPLLTGERDGKLHGVDPSGHERWTYESGACTDLGAVATAETVLAFVTHTCDEQPDELTALDVQTGKKLWTRTSTTNYRRPVVVASLVVVAEPGGDSEEPAALSAIEPRTGDVRWTWKVPASWACRTLLNAAGKYVIVVDCPGPSSVENRKTVVTAIDANTGLTAWQTVAPVNPQMKVTVTADGRVVSLSQAARGCAVNVISSTGFRQVRLPTGISCGRDPRAVGNLVLTSGAGTVIALR
ncbi:MAG: PQQ-binding-like beta-propeller repeat protein, partial [Kribbellaceae bacterium]|nr:PQQ-binding-like beta-propeller repeat protein [Kribbellaceae bacterium]